MPAIYGEFTPEEIDIFEGVLTPKMWFDVRVQFWVEYVEGSRYTIAAYTTSAPIAWDYYSIRSGRGTPSDLVVDIIDFISEAYRNFCETAGVRICAYGLSLG